MLALFGAGILYIAILILIESPLPRKVISYVKRNFQQTTYFQTQAASSVDEDVLREENEISNFMMTSSSRCGINSNGNMIVHNLRKQFKDLVAVDTVSFQVPSQKCFGLLGINGAGKTTTFSMLTGDLEMTSGDAIIDSLSVKDDLRLVSTSLSYSL